ncbi:hypothetical protein A2U01_0053780, partial [Trifolium medium]|nr:hypothetical protein [Trifolium medium]
MKLEASINSRQQLSHQQHDYGAQLAA